MDLLFYILMGLLIVVANVLGFLSFRKKKSLYSGALTVLLMAPVLGGIGGVISLLVIRDAFAVFYGLQVAYFLLVNSAIILVIAVITSAVRNYRTP
ncbi:3-isopropylmalate dehydrogenase [Rossellomorea marisflavi]|uniref:3-isopropylmalate dehydrogenase n=1 Tax=Rossellomorea marisflavi TaxID=189381 RepID=A0A5D4RYI7_9BACI|nr:3-isopropylmalate dehydrogenase [Rossellomorea marisflavi]TYS54824.1 3-isopropylmalate dehydrogenase [Rossellomorea marisflavi]